MEKTYNLDRVSVRLVKERPLISSVPLNNPTAAIEVMGEYLAQMDREVLMLLNLDTKLKPINCSIVSIGAINETVAHPREIFKAAFLSNASYMMLLHNHPSGDITPSKIDSKLTDRMIKLCDQMGIPLVDHIIVGADGKEFFSFNEKQMMDKARVNYIADYNQITLSVAVAEGKKR